MAEIVTVGNQRFKRRNIIAVWLGLPIITLGVYRFVWYYKINNEARRYLADPSINPLLSLLAVTLGAFLIVPPVISVYRTAQRVQRMQQRAGVPRLVTPWIAAVLLFVFALDTLYLQMALNEVWDRHLGRLPTLSALPPPPPQLPTAAPPSS